MLISCQSENGVAKTTESLQTQEMKNFNAAFKSLGNPENRPTEEEKRSGSAEEHPIGDPAYFNCGNAAYLTYNNYGIYTEAEWFTIGNYTYVQVFDI